MNKLRIIKRGLLALIMCLSLSLCGCGNSNQPEEPLNTSSAETQQNDDVSSETTEDNAVNSEVTTTNSEPEETTAITTTESTETTAETETSIPEEPTDETTENTYEHNEYYDIVETASYQNSIGYTIVIHKVLAKKDVSISATLLAYGNDGNVLGKSSDDIVLTEGQYNFFRYSFDSDISSASIQANAKAQKDSFMIGERNAVEMVQYNQSGDDLYITLKQTGDKIGSFVKFKILFYKRRSDC